MNLYPALMVIDLDSLNHDPYHAMLNNYIVRSCMIKNIDKSANPYAYCDSTSINALIYKYIYILKRFI